MTNDTGQKIAYFICFAVVSIAVTGYFIGLQSPMNRADATLSERTIKLPSSVEPDTRNSSSDVMPATSYAEMHQVTIRNKAKWRTKLTDLKMSFDPMAEVIVTPEEKAFALELRSANRAFNGAPPTIPHSIDQLSSATCMACHGEGVKTQSLRISKMSHQFLANCTQCHAESDPQHMPGSLFRQNSFVGMPAPSGGPRAFEGAPPMIPHSTWMRVDCMSCHGFNGIQGIRSTHPWRTNCQQCHAPRPCWIKSTLTLNPNSFRHLQSKNSRSQVDHDTIIQQDFTSRLVPVADP